MSDWWTAEQAGLIGAFGGSAVGVLGGLFGTVVGVCSPRGIARGPVLVGHAALVALGIVTLAVGIVGAAMGQPGHVYRPLVLGGFILAAVTGPMLPVVRARYRQAEERRLEAEQLRRG